MIAFFTSKPGLVVIAAVVISFGGLYIKSIKSDLKVLETQNEALIAEKDRLAEINKNNELVMKKMEAHISKLNESRVRLEKARQQNQTWSSSTVDRIRATDDKAPVSQSVHIALTEIIKKEKASK